MPTQCSRDLFGYEVVEGRQVVAAFDGGEITSDAGALLLGATDRAIGLVTRFAACFDDGRVQAQVEHTIEAMIAQRVFGIALGYEDLIDHDQLRHDPVLATLAGKLQAKRETCAPLAGKSTLNRLEHAPLTPSRYHKIDHDAAAIEGLFVDLFLDAHRTPPEEIVLDLDATDDPLHGHQEGRFFHGYYDGYCYLPLYVFCGRHLLAAKLRRANIDASAGALAEIGRIVGQIRARWPRVKIVLRADSGFARDPIMTWCEANGIDYVFGLPRNERLVGAITEELAAAELDSLAQSGPARRFADFLWTTLDSWSRERRVIAKAEHLLKGPNPRFVVTSLPASAIDPRTLYEDLYCARGEVENRIKEQQLDLFAGRTSAATMRANQLRLWFASFAYVLLEALRRIGLRHTQFATATCGTIRLKLLKIGAHWPPGWGTGPQPRFGGQSPQRAPDQGGHGFRLPVPDRVPPRLPLPEARCRLLSAQTYRRSPAPRATTAATEICLDRR
jgi:Transposase DDE domain group 1